MSNKSARIFQFEQLLFSKAGFAVVKAAVVVAGKSAFIAAALLSGQNKLKSKTWLVSLLYISRLFDQDFNQLVMIDAIKH